MGGVAAVGGYFLYRFIFRFTNRSPRAVAVSAGLAAFASVPLAASAFGAEFALAGTTSSISVGSILVALVGVHVLIGVGEGLLTFLVVGAVTRSRPDLVYGAPTYTGDRTEELVQ